MERNRIRMEINGYTRICGLIGNPVEHTMSPAIHNTLAEEQGENLVYVPLHVPSGQVEEAVRGAFALNLLGVNVTVPYKSEVIPFLEGIDPLAEQIGAVNTLVRGEKGFIGYNTDMPGLYRAMCEDGVDITGENVLILGAGGAARAVAMLAARKGARKIVLLNRTLMRAERLAEEVNGAAGGETAVAMALENYSELPSGERFLAIQTTNVGMFPKTEETLIEDEAFYKRVHTGYDLIFNPARTRFMSLVEKGGGRAFNGMKMLLYQGVIAYELWTGRQVEGDLARKAYGEMKKAMERKTDVKKDSIVLTGFMGSGKTSVGLRLSYRLRRPVEDTDKLIERREGRSVSDIFAAEGEEYFRSLETKLLQELSGRDWPRIYSVGGGTPLRPCNRELLRRLGKVVYLRVRPETVYERLKGDTTRPLLQCSEPLAQIRKMLERRREAYESAAHVILDVDDMSLDEIADRIVDMIEEQEGTQRNSTAQGAGRDGLDSLGKEDGRRSMRLLVINGPNINFLGIREKSVYGSQDYQYLLDMIEKKAQETGSRITVFQSNHEGAIIDRIQEAYFDGTEGIVINPGAFTHYSYAIRDALASIEVPKVEIHISDITKREEFRKISVTAPVCDRQIYGQGLEGYLQAVDFILGK